MRCKDRWSSTTEPGLQAELRHTRMRVTQLYSPCGELYCYAVIFALRRVILLRSYIRLAASYIATQWYSAGAEWYSLREFAGANIITLRNEV